MARLIPCPTAPKMFTKNWMLMNQETQVACIQQSIWELPGKRKGELKRYSRPAKFLVLVSQLLIIRHKEKLVENRAEYLPIPAQFVNMNHELISWYMQDELDKASQVCIILGDLIYLRYNNSTNYQQQVQKGPYILQGSIIHEEMREGGGKKKKGLTDSLHHARSNNHMK